MDTTSTDISPNMCQITPTHSQIIASASSVLVLSILLVVPCLFILVCVCMYCFRTGHYIFVYESYSVVFVTRLKADPDLPLSCPPKYVLGLRGELTWGAYVTGNDFPIWIITPHEQLGSAAWGVLTLTIPVFLSWCLQATNYPMQQWTSV